MKLYCEIVAKELLPALRALLAKSMIGKYKLTQQETAKKLGLTQGAISQYNRYLRGVKAQQIEKDENVYKEIEKLAGKLVSGISHKEAIEDLYEICKSTIKKFGDTSHSENCKICFT